MRRNYKECDVADGCRVHAAAPTCKGVHHKELDVPSETVSQCSKAYVGALERQREVESANKTNTTNNDSNIETVGTDTSWSNKG